jgi:D-amino-acid dehydrogenase
MNREPDVLILGAGAIGLCCAYYLLKSGHSVTLLDQGTPGNGSSHGNCGTITPSHAPPLSKPGMVGQALRWMLDPDAPLYVKPRFDPTLFAWLIGFARRCNWPDFNAGLRAKAALLKPSRHALETLIADEGLACEFEAKGHLTVFKTAQALEAFAWWPKALSDVGIDVKTLDGPTLRQLEPALRDDVIGGFDTPGDAQFKPDAFVAALAQRVTAMGATIETGFRVDRIDQVEGRVSVAGERGTRSGRFGVLALGAWSPLLARGLDLRIPVQPGKGYSITTERPARAPSVPVVCRERSIAITPWQQSYRVGSTMEFSGYDATLNRRRIEALVSGAREYLIDPIGTTRVEEWFGWRPMSVDDVPIIGRARGDLWLATGHGMLGMSMSAGTGQLIADLIAGRVPAIDPTPYAPQRFQ